MAEKDAEGHEQSKSTSDLVARTQSAEQTTAELLTGIEGLRATLEDLKTQSDALRGGVSSAISAATHHVAIIETLRARAETALKAIEEDTRKANSESGFAFNAKTNAEDHAKAIAQIRGTVDATFAGMTATKSATDEITKGITALKVAADADAKVIVDSKATVTRDAAQVTAANERVAAVLPSIEQGSKDANAITAAKAGAESGAAAVQVLQQQMTELVAKAAADGAAISKADEESKKLVTAMNDARTTADEANVRLEAYEQEISKMQIDFSAMQAKLEGLLPHATSAGLASAFHSQKARFSKPQPWWLALFVFAILCLVAAAGYGLPAATDNWDAILRHLVNRIPLVAPLVWLAIYAGHHYSMALRMEEDYAFKEAVSTAFEGYKREMLAIPASPGKDVSPLVTLCENVLQALAERPGRIYEGKNDVVTPLTPAISGIKDMLAEALKRKEAR
jgi:uncharacterized coiled-coil DUF342 family protein